MRDPQTSFRESERPTKHRWRHLAVCLCATVVAVFLASACTEKPPPAAVEDVLADSASEDVIGDSDDQADTTSLLDAEASDATSDSSPDDSDGADPADDQADAAASDTEHDSAPRPLEELEHLTDDALRTALSTVSARNHVTLGYDAAREAMYAPDHGLDVVGGAVECIYTGVAAWADGTVTPGGVINTEHSWPQSLGAAEEPARGDLHHLFPVLASANSVRGNLPYGDTDCSETGTCIWAEGESELGTRAGGGERVFEVRPARRGDIARAQLYFAVRYRLPLAESTEASLRDWHDEDPPDARERARNDAIEALQGNRNPFIDRPDFVWQISDF